MTILCSIEINLNPVFIMFVWFFCSLLFLTPLKCLADATSDSNTNENNATQVEEETVVYPLWIGPGLYYGIWFDNEEDYNHWQSENQNRQQNHQNRNSERNQQQAGEHQGGQQKEGQQQRVRPRREARVNRRSHS